MEPGISVVGNADFVLTFLGKPVFSAAVFDEELVVPQPLDEPLNPYLVWHIASHESPEPSQTGKRRLWVLEYQP